MMRLLLIIPVFLMAACASDPIKLPDFSVAEASYEEITLPTEYPELCEVPWTTADCYQRLDVYEDVAENNKELARLNAEIAEDSQSAYSVILSAAQKQQDIALIREDMLQESRRKNFMDNLWHRGLIALGVLAAVL